MAKQIRLKDQNNDNLVVQQGESFNFEATFTDLASTPAALTSSDILTLTLTLFAATTIINSRDAQSIKNANGGTLTAAGALTLKLDPADQTIVDGALAAGGTEQHVARIDWTWNDGASRTGRAEYLFEVEKLASPS